MPFIAQGKTNLKYILILVVLAVIVGGGILGYQYWWGAEKGVKIQEVKTKKILFGENKILTVNPGDIYELTDKEIIVRFSRSGTEFSVPDVIFGEEYILNNLEKINYLPIYNFIEIYHDGNVISLRKENCTIKEVFTDILERHVVNCQIAIEFRKEDITVEKKLVNKTIQGSGGPIYRPDYIATIQGNLVSQNPFLYVGIPEFWVQSTLNGIDAQGGASKVGGGYDYALDFQIITNFGIGAIRYIPRELYTEVSKQIIIEPAIITISPVKPKDMGPFCYKGPAGATDLICKITNKQFSFDISMGFKEQLEIAPKIVNFSY